jgi:hypothetical protein
MVWISGTKLVPLSESGASAIFEIISAVERVFLVEVIGRYILVRLN